jgi:DNA-binding IclR family transcriptional regulator
VVTVLEFLAARPDERFTLSELARGCDLNKATAHALLTELTARGVLLRHPDEKRYSLGPRLVPVGDAAARGYRAEDFTAGASASPAPRWTCTTPNPPSRTSRCWDWTTCC